MFKAPFPRAQARDRPQNWSKRNQVWSLWLKEFLRYAGASARHSSTLLDAMAKADDFNSQLDTDENKEDFDLDGFLELLTINLQKWSSSLRPGALVKLEASLILIFTKITAMLENSKEEVEFTIVSKCIGILQHFDTPAMEKLMQKLNNWFMEEQGKNVSSRLQSTCSKYENDPSTRMLQEVHLAAQAATSTDLPASDWELLHKVAVKSLEVGGLARTFTHDPHPSVLLKFWALLEEKAVSSKMPQFGNIESTLKDVLILGNAFHDMVTKEGIMVSIMEAAAEVQDTLPKVQAAEGFIVASSQAALRARARLPIVSEDGVDPIAANICGTFAEQIMKAVEDTASNLDECFKLVLETSAMKLDRAAQMLQQVAGGGPNGTVWSDNIANDKDIVTHYSDTLGLLNIDQVVQYSSGLQAAPSFARAC